MSPNDKQPNAPRKLIVLGSTGSIGTNTLDVVGHLKGTSHALEVVGLAAGRQPAKALLQPLPEREGGLLGGQGVGQIKQVALPVQRHAGCVAVAVDQLADFAGFRLVEQAQQNLIMAQSQKPALFAKNERGELVDALKTSIEITDEPRHYEFRRPRGEGIVPISATHMSVLVQKGQMNLQLVSNNSGAKVELEEFFRPHRTRFAELLPQVAQRLGWEAVCKRKAKKELTRDATTHQLTKGCQIDDRGKIPSQVFRKPV